METSVTVHGKRIVVEGEKADELSRSASFLRWLQSSDPALEVSWISEQWSFWRKKDRELIFAIFLYEYIDETGRFKKSLFFFRSDSAAVFLVLKDSEMNRKFVVLVEQIRGPVGGKIIEIPAGTLEEGESSTITMAREITEETGLHVKAASLIDLGTYYFSPGACSEQITLYCCELEMSIEKILALDKRLAGLREHGENIKVRLCAFNKFERLNINIRDAKTQLAYELYLRKYGCKK